jgi:hypothetical protein
MKPDLSESQVKALLRVASKAPRHAPPPHAELLARVTAATTPVAELREIKERAKALLHEAQDRPQRDAAQVLYHAAVAAAFVHHAAEISGRPMHKQHALYERLATAWAGHGVGRLFHDAAARLAGPEQAE